MADEGFKRKLTAILSADVEGYSRLMGDDEDATIRTLTTYREIISTIIQKHQGRVIDSPGDNLLAEFGSVVETVRSAVEIQEELRIRNAELPDDRRMEFRIGINLGDVVEEGERIYGDGVNITARVEELADAGGICISGTVYDSIKNKLSVGYESLGEHTVKNIKEPVRIYRMRVGPDAAALEASKKKKLTVKRWQWAAMAVMIVLILGAVTVWNLYFRSPPIEPASIDRMALPLPDKPSIAVLPFVNMSEDKNQEFFSDGITEDIITALSKTPRLFVIASNSTFTYKGKAVKIQKVAEDLGVRYVLEGSVRRSENNVRVTAQLIDALKGTHIWAEKYDRDLKDIFAIQDDITQEIIASLQVKLTEGEQARIWSRSTQNAKAYEKALESLEHFRRFNPDDVILCRKKAEEAIALDPNYPFAYALLAWSHLIEVWNGWSKSPEESMKKAVEMGQMTLSLDENYEGAHALLGSIYLLQKKWDRAVEEGERAVELAPSGADANGILGITLRYVGRPEEAVSLFEKAIRLNPSTPNWLYHNLGAAQILTGDYQNAITSLKRVIEKNPNHVPAKRDLIIAYSLSNQDEIARSQMEEYLKLMPSDTIESWRKRLTFKNEGDKDLYVGALRKVGFPEHPPLKLPDKPSIAVLAFENMSGDPKQEYFSDGLSEEIITALSKTPKLFVIARNSSFIYKGKPVKVQQIGRELGVKYVLEGSVRKSGDRVRITAQLVDAQTGNHLWADRYDREMKDLFALQDEITLKVLAAVHIKLKDREEIKYYQGTDNLEAFLKLLQARWYLLKFTKAENILGRELAQQAIELDPGYAQAYQSLAGGLMLSVWFGLSQSPKETLMQAIKMAEKAVEIDESFENAHGLLAFLYTLVRKHDLGIKKGERAVSLNPNCADCYGFLGIALRYSDRPQQAIANLNIAMRLNPFPKTWYYHHLGGALSESNQYEEAIKVFKEGISRYPDDQFQRYMLAWSYIYAGREEDARIQAAEVLRINPKFSVEQWAKTYPHINRSLTERHMEAMRKAGLK